MKEGEKGDAVGTILLLYPGTTAALKLSLTFLSKDTNQLISNTLSERRRKEVLSVVFAFKTFFTLPLLSRQ
jgi:hypothetical protein